MRAAGLRRALPVCRAVSCAALRTVQRALLLHAIDLGADLLLHRLVLPTDSTGPVQKRQGPAYSRCILGELGQLPVQMS